MLTGENGILIQAQKAKTETEQAGDIEKIRLAISEAKIGESAYQELYFHSFQKALNSQFGEDNVIVSIEEDGTYTVSCLSSLKDYTVSENDIEQTIDWNEKMASAVAPESQDEERNNGVIGIGTDGNPVDMDLWEYTFDDETGGYALSKEGTVGYKGKIEVDGTIEGTVPQYIKISNGEWTPVTSLLCTFRGYANEELKKLAIAPKIPPTVKRMELTFEGCENLTNLTCIPGSVKVLKWNGLTGLEEMPEIGYGVEDMTGAFSSCSGLNKVSIMPDTVKILYSTFSHCTNLQEAPKIPDSVVNMDRTFDGCTNLQEVPNIPNIVINMNRTFASCTKLGYIEITIPENVTNITQTFDGCTNLEGKITINCNPENHVNFLQWTTKPITLTGKSTMLSQIKEGRSNVTVVEE